MWNDCHLFILPLLRRSKREIKRWHLLVAWLLKVVLLKTRGGIKLDSDMFILKKWAGLISLVCFDESVTELYQLDEWIDLTVIEKLLRDTKHRNSQGKLFFLITWSFDFWIQFSTNVHIHIDPMVVDVSTHPHLF